MANLEVILNLIDNLTPTIESARTSVENLSSTIDTASNSIDSVKADSIENVGNVSTVVSENVNNITDAADNTASSMDSIDSSTLDNVNSAADNAASSVEGIESASSDAAAGLAGIDDTSIKETGAAAGDAAAAGEELAGSLGLVESALAGIAGLGIAAFLTKATDLAGNMSDRWERINIQFGNTSTTVMDMQNKFGNAINQMIKDTGRGKGDILDVMNKMGIAGIKTEETLVKSFDAIAGAAYMTKKPLSTVSTAFNRIVGGAQLSDRIIRQLGISISTITEITGLSMDELKEKFKNMDAEQRAMYLSGLLSAAGAAEANEAYKQSWDHVKDALDRAGQGILRIVGSMILPVVIPVLERVTDILNQVGKAIDSIPGSIKTVLGLIIVVIAAIGFIGASLTVLSTIVTWSGFSFIGLGSGISLASIALGIFEVLLGPIGLVLLAISAIIIAAIVIWQKWNKEIIQLIDNLKQGNWDEVAKQIGDSFNYISKVVLDALVNAGQQIRTFFAGLPRWIGENATKMLEVGKDFADWLIRGLKWATAHLGNIIEDMLKSADANAQEGGQGTGKKTGNGILDGLKNWWNDNKGAIFDLLKTIFFEITPLLIQLIFQLSTIIALSMWNVASEAGKSFNKALEEWLTHLGTDIWNWLSGSLQKLNNFATETYKKGQEAAIKLITGIISYLQELPGKMWDWLLQTLQKISAFAKDAEKKARDTGKQIVDKIISTISSLPGQMYNWGIRTINDFIAGIRSKFPILNAALDYIGKRIESNSPPKEGPLSKVTSEGWYEFGSSLTNALNKGLESETSELYNFIPLKKQYPIITEKNTSNGRALVLGRNEMTLNLVLDFKNVPSKLTKEELLSVFKSMTNNHELIDAMIKLLSRAKLDTKTNLGI